MRPIAMDTERGPTHGLLHKRTCALTFCFRTEGIHRDGSEVVLLLGWWTRTRL